MIYELNALRQEVADLRAAQQERNDRDAERDHLMRVNSHMIHQMFEGEKNHKKGGLNCVFGNFFFYVLDNCSQVQSLK